MSNKIVHKNKLGNRVKFIGKVVLLIPGILIAYWIFLALYGAFVIEGSCDKEANAKVKNPTEIISATQYEKDHWPQLTHTGKITRVGHEILTCEHQKGEKFKTFIFF